MKVFFLSVKSYLDSCVQQLIIDILFQNIQSQPEPYPLLLHFDRGLRW